MSMKNNLLRKVVSGLAVFALFGLILPSAMAIGIRPLRNELNLDPGTSAEGEVMVVNEGEADIVAEAVVQVFTKNSETGAPIYPTEEDLAIEDVRSWIDISLDPVAVPAQSQVAVPYTVTVPADAVGGGRYATIAYQPVKDTGGGIAVRVRAASLLYINVQGELILDGEVSRFGLPEMLAGDQPFIFEVTFQNNGNTHLKPKGWIAITDLDTGRKLTEIGEYADPETREVMVVDALPVNQESGGNVLPGSLRTYQAVWEKKLAVGSYRADLNLEYADGTTPITQSFEFEIGKGLKVDDFTINLAEDSASFDLTVTNEGSVYEKLQGAIAISNTFGYQVAEVLIPEDIEYIAPGETKSFTFDWLDKELPQDRYTAKLAVTYGFTGEVLEAKVSFGQLDRSKLYMGIALIIAVLVALVAIFRKKK